MKKHIFSFLIAIFIFNCSVFSQSIDRYYYYKGERKNININDQLYCIVTSNENFDFAALSDKYNIEISDTYKNLYKNSIAGRYWRIFKIKKENFLKEEAINDYLSDINKDSMIIQIYPIIGSEHPVAVSDFFYVKLKNKIDYKLLELTAEINKCEIIRQVDYMPLWYILKAPLGSNGLNMSNLFYATSYFQDVDPGFVFDYKQTCITDSLFNQQWALKDRSSFGIDACSAWSITRGSSNVIVAVLDQGIDTIHNEFSTNISNLSFDAENDNSPSRLYDTHGTHVAGIIGANQNGYQISGIAPLVNLMPVSHSLLISDQISQQLASGITWAWQNGADIINNSWGDQGGAFYNDLHSSLLEDAINDALHYGRNGLGCVIVFAAGNYAPTMDYPAYCNDDILCVGSINNSGLRSSFSGYGVALDVVAPGSDILSTLPNNQTGVMSGTSMAAPHVSGIAALVLSVNPNLTQAQVRQVIESTCTKLPGYTYSNNSAHPNGTWNNEVGHGLVNAYGAVYAVAPKIIIPNSPLQRFTPVTISWQNVPERNDYRLTCRIVESGAPFFILKENCGTSFTFVPPYSGNYTIEATLRTNDGLTYQATRFVSVLPAGAQIEGPQSLGPGETGTYTFRTAFNNPVDVRAAGEPAVLFSWSYFGSGVEKISETPTSITLKSTRTAQDCGNGNITLWFNIENTMLDPIHTQSEGPYQYSFDIALPAPNNLSINVGFLQKINQGNGADLYMFQATPNLPNYVWTYHPFGLYTTLFPLPMPMSIGNLGIVEIPSYVFNFNVRATITNACGTFSGLYTVDNRAGFTQYFKAFPNPATDIITVQSAVDIQESLSKNTAISSDEVFNIELYELHTSTLVRRSTFRGAMYTFNVSGLKNGIYLLKITKGEHSEMHTILINH